MGRWQPGAVDRITEAAIQLFRDNGFESTTAAEIAERAGVTRRTFFRYFADKRDVLFSEHDKLGDVVASVVAAAPPQSSASSVLSTGFHRLADDVFAGRRERVRVLHRIIVSDDSLREREQHKNAIIADAGERAFLARGFDPASARLAAGLGVLVLSLAIERWIEDDDSDLGAIADDLLRSIGDLVNGEAP
jgi:AcrR family transcriptional regulator